MAGQLISGTSMASIRRRVIASSPHIAIVSGKIANFRTDISAPLKSLKIEFTPKQEGSGDPSPSNVRNMVTWSGFNVWKTGKSMYPLSGIATNSGTYSVSGDSLTVNNADYGGYSERLGHYLSAGTYTVSRSVPYGQVRYYQDATGEKTAAAHNVSSKSFTLADGGITKIKVGNGNTSGYPFTTTFMIEYGSTPSAYESYNGTTIPVDWSSAGNIYGGYVDLVSGEVWKTWEYHDMGEFNWSSPSTADSSNATLSGIDGYGGDADTLPNVYAESWKVLTLRTFNNSIGVDGFLMSINSTQKLYIMSPTFHGMSKSQIKNYVTGMNIALKLATPTPLTTLTPAILRTLRGVNNIWTDANGNVTAQYWTH